ncbi:MAG: hypothetical protein LQ349_006744 [Xanthoria aureola]|nr:MAG: hypothetical protein LQ349_006744 [Xanthoria aureola]
MQLTAFAALLATGYALPSWPSTNKGELSSPSANLPNSPEVIEALSNPDRYDQLSARFAQSPLRLDHVFKKDSSGDTCGIQSVCPAYEGKTEKINGRKYNLYCINAPWGSYFWLPAAKSLEECEANCHKNSYDCNGLTFYPTTGACSLIYSKDATPYIWDNGYPKIGAIPVSNQPTAFPPGTLCPLPASDNQVWHYGAHNEYPFKMSCLNAFNVPAAAKKNKGYVGEVDECAIPCAEDDACFGFHYYQENLVGQRADGKRVCEHVVEKVKEGMWTAVFKPNQALAGLKIGGDWQCGEEGWDQDNGCRGN